MTVVPAPGAKPLPVIVTDVPPARGPLFGLTLVTAGMNLKWSLSETVLVPAGVATVMSTTAALWAGAIAVIDVEELTVKLAAAVEPKLTAVALEKCVPAIVTDVPPGVSPDLGDTFVTVGSPCASRCLHWLPWLLHSCWYQYRLPPTTWL